MRFCFVQFYVVELSNFIYMRLCHCIYMTVQTLLKLLPAEDYHN